MYSNLFLLYIFQPPAPITKVKKPSNSLVNSEDSGETTDNFDASDFILNPPARTINRRFSDVSNALFLSLHLHMRSAVAHLVER